MALFSDIKKNQVFKCNGNICVKQSGKTAKLIEFDKTFYFKQYEIVKPVYLDEIAGKKVMTNKIGSLWFKVNGEIYVRTIKNGFVRFMNCLYLVDINKFINVSNEQYLKTKLD